MGLSLLSCAVGGHPVRMRGQDAGYWEFKNMYGTGSPKRPDSNEDQSVIDSILSRHPGIKLSENFINFLSKCLQSNPNDRATCETLQRHPFLMKPDNTFEGTGVSPQERSDLAEILDDARFICVKVCEYHINEKIKARSTDTEDPNGRSPSYSFLQSESRTLPLPDSAFLMLAVQLGCSWTSVKEIFQEEWVDMCESYANPVDGSFDDFLTSSNRSAFSNRTESQS
mmetsp:Transcript_24609/g.32124  ORF Transcript_24609/g.32124 Transcript_24609/m.32124 type:complete len:226 (+) Transcript_24609:1-678(+)